MANNDTIYFDLPCDINFCPQEETTDSSYLLDNSPTLNDTAQKFIIEFGSDQSDIIVDEGSSIKINDTIGYISNVPVRSIIKGTVTKKYNRYFFGEYSTDENAIDDILNGKDLSEESLKAFNDDNPISKINELLNNYQYATTFIKDYIMFFRFPDLVSNTLDHISSNVLLSAKSINEAVDSYEKKANEILDEYNNNIQKICGKDNVKSYADKNDLNSLKKTIDSTTTKYLSKIIEQYKNAKSYAITPGKFEDLCIYSYYLDYITSNNFRYDSKNEYVVELVNKISEYIGVRLNLELNTGSIEGLISNFNNMCNQYISQYFNSKNYYEQIKSIFQYDYYTDDIDELIEAKKTDTNRLTIYDKVLSYLENLTNYQTPVSNQEKYASMDVDSLINGTTIEDTDEEKSNASLLSNLKRIAITFIQIRKVETGSNSFDFSKYTDEFSLNDVNVIVTNFNNIAAIDPAISQDILLQNSVIDKYIGVLRSVSQKESEELCELCDSAIKFYNDNKDAINSGKIFEELHEVKWSGKSTVYKDGEPYDFYFIEDDVTINENKKEDKPAYNYTEDSVATEYGVDSIQYWLKYCAIATSVNCTLPIYWSVGLIIAGMPIFLPVILVPIYVSSGRVSIVIGVGICGLFIYPMGLFYNMSNLPGSIIPTINVAVDYLRALPEMIMNSPKHIVKTLVKEMIDKNDEKINELNLEIYGLQKDIDRMRSEIQVDKETIRNLKKKKKQDSTTKRKRKKADEE